MPKRKIDALGAFWKNDLPEGVGYECPKEDLLPDEEIYKHLDACESFFQEQKRNGKEQEFVDSLFEQLRYAAAHKNEMDIAHGFAIIFMNVWVLEKHGYIKTDDFNGAMFVYA